MMRPALLLLLALAAAPKSGAAADAPSGPAAAWGGHWDVERTASVRLYHEIGQPVGPLRLRELEETVQRLADELGLGAAQRASLRIDPIEYLYVQDSAQLRWFGVDDVDGMALAEQRRIVASRLPHEHELVHVLAQVAIDPAPGDNQPWLQEGLASYLGGHLGEAPAAVLATGDQVLEAHPGLLRSLMTVEGFRESPLPAASCYAASARFLQFLDETRGGRPPILELLGLLAGYHDEVVQRPASIVETQIEGVYDVAISSLLEEFSQWRRENPPSGIVPAAVPRRPADIVLVDDDHRVRWWIDEAGWVLAATPLRDTVDLALTWAGPGAGGAGWTGPPRPSGFELRLDDEGGHLLHHGRPGIRLRWYRPESPGPAPAGPVWFLPAAALGDVSPPSGAERVVLWSQPRFRVD